MAAATRSEAELALARGKQRVAWYEFGEERRPKDAPTVLLLHANPGSPRDFDAVAPGLLSASTSPRLVALAFAGYGETDITPPNPANPNELLASVDYATEQLTQFLDAGDVVSPSAPLVMLGNSMGACAAVRYAATTTNVERIRGLVLVSPGGFTKHNALTRTFCVAMASPWLAPSPLTFGKLYTRHKDQPFVQALLQRYATDHAAPRVREAIRAVWASFSQPGNDVRALAPALKPRVLLVMGAHDPVISPRGDGRVARAVLPPSHEYAELPTGHVVFAEAPHDFLRVVEPFLTKCFTFTS